VSVTLTTSGNTTSRVSFSDSALPLHCQAITQPPWPFVRVVDHEHLLAALAPGRFCRRGDRQRLRYNLELTGNAMYALVEVASLPSGAWHSPYVRQSMASHSARYSRVLMRDALLSHITTHDKTSPTPARFVRCFSDDGARLRMTTHRFRSRPEIALASNPDIDAIS